MNSNKLYVGGLPYSVTDDKLQEIFSPHGTVESARVITDRMTGRFDPYVALSRFAAANDLSDTILVVDEAHNLLDHRRLEVFLGRTLTGVVSSL